MISFLTKAPFYWATGREIAKVDIDQIVNAAQNQPSLQKKAVTYF
jgi:hypothetical protein